MVVRKPQIDPAHEETERLLAQMEKRIQKEYSVAEKEIQAKIDDYMDRFALKDQKWQEWVKDGTKTKAQYQQWRIGQMAVGKRWESLKQTVSEDLYHADQIAKSIVKGYMPEVYATNFNYGTYEAEVGAHVDTSFTLYSRESVERLYRKDPDILPAPGKKVSKEIAEGRAVRWNKQQLQSVMTQGILQGDSIPKLASRLAKEVGDSDMKASIRNARTMATGVQNAGRVDAYKRAQDKGIKMVQMWRATLDNRTRHSHRQLDGEKQPVGEPFSNGCEFPGDPHGAPSEIYNCRCTLRGVVAGLEPQAIKYRDTSAIGNISYDEWKAQKQSESNPITLQKEKGEAIEESYKNEYRKPVASARSNSKNAANDISGFGKEVYYDENATYKIYVDGYDDKINKALSSAAKKVAKAGSKDRYEYAALIDLANGEMVDFGTDEERGHVGHYQKYLRKHLDGRFAIVHNHLTENSLSLPDVMELSSWENVELMSAVSNNGLTRTIKSNGFKSNDYLYNRYAKQSQKLRSEGKSDVEIELALADIAIGEFSDGGIIYHDGRSKNR